MNLVRPNATTKGKLDDIVLVWGASSSVGLYAVQLAAQAGMFILFNNISINIDSSLGYRVIATASKHNFDLLKEVGAEAVFDHSAADVVAQIKKAAGKEIKYVYDTIGSEETTKKSIESVSPNGILNHSLLVVYFYLTF